MPLHPKEIPRSVLALQESKVKNWQRPVSYDSVINEYNSAQNSCSHIPSGNDIELESVLQHVPQG